MRHTNIYRRIFLFQTTAQVKQLQQDRIKNTKRSTVQPLIIAISPTNIDAANDFVVVIDEHLYLSKSGREAIDFCFKLFHVLDVQYSPQAMHILTLIQRILYKFDTDKDVVLYWEKIWKQIEAHDFTEKEANSITIHA